MKDTPLWKLSLSLLPILYSPIIICLARSQRAFKLTKKKKVKTIEPRKWCICHFLTGTLLLFKEVYFEDALNFCIVSACLIIFGMMFHKFGAASCPKLHSQTMRRMTWVFISVRVMTHVLLVFLSLLTLMWWIIDSISWITHFFGFDVGITHFVTSFSLLTNLWWVAWLKQLNDYSESFNWLSQVTRVSLWTCPCTFTLQISWNEGHYTCSSFCDDLNIYFKHFMR